jgi:quercetin dioxygenase-like cupin family protein
MQICAFLSNVAYNNDGPKIELMFQNNSSKELRIAMKAGQVMKSHKAPFPITVSIFKGRINFGVNGIIQNLTIGDVVALDSNVVHDLTALKDSIIRLSLSRADSEKRVQAVVKS